LLGAAIEAKRFDAVIMGSTVMGPDPRSGDEPWKRISRAVFAHYGLAYHGGEVNLLTRLR